MTKRQCAQTQRTRRQRCSRTPPCCSGARPAACVWFPPGTQRSRSALLQGNTLQKLSALQLLRLEWGKRPWSAFLHKVLFPVNHPLSEEPTQHLLKRARILSSRFWPQRLWVSPLARGVESREKWVGLWGPNGEGELGTASLGGRLWGSAGKAQPLWTSFLAVARLHGCLSPEPLGGQPQALVSHEASGLLGHGLSLRGEACLPAGLWPSRPGTGFPLFVASLLGRLGTGESSVSYLSLEGSDSSFKTQTGTTTTQGKQYFKS